MSSSRSKLPLLLYGILLCSCFAPLPAVSSTGQTSQSAGSLVQTSSSSWDPSKGAVREGEYLLEIKRLRRLYCNVGIGFHIQVLPNGRITGVHSENRYTLLEISPVERGVVTLFGVRSGLFIAMSIKGKLYGSAVSPNTTSGWITDFLTEKKQRQHVWELLTISTGPKHGHYNDECKFKENFLANNYNAYESAAYPGMYIGLSKTGKAKRGNRVTPTMTMTHFLPRI